MQRKEMRSPVIFTLIRTVSIALLSFISFPFASQALGPSAMGMYGWANTFVYYFLILSRLGIPLIATRECAKVKDDKEALNSKVQSFFVLQLITTALSFIAFAAIMFAGRGTIVSEDLWQLVFLLSTNFLVGVFSFEWVYIALDRVFYTSVRSIAITVFGTLLMIIFVRNDHDLYIYAFLNLLATFLTVLSNVIFLKREGIAFSLKHKINLKYLTKSLLFVFGITFIITAYNQSDSLLLGYIDDSFRSTGAYSVGIRGIEIVITIITSLSAVFVIRTTKALRDDDLPSFNAIINYSSNIILFIGVPAVMFVIGLAPEIINFIVAGSPYWDAEATNNAVLALSILAPLMLTYSIHDGIYQQVLVPLKKEKAYFITMLIALVFNISMSVVFALFVFPNNSLLGVALITMVSEVLILIVLFSLTRQYTVRHFFNWNNLKIIGASAISLALVLLLKSFVPPIGGLAIVGLSIVVGGIIYLGLLFVSKEQLVYDLVKGGQNGR